MTAFAPLLAAALLTPSFYSAAPFSCCSRIKSMGLSQSSRLDDNNSIASSATENASTSRTALSSSPSFEATAVYNTPLMASSLQDVSYQTPNCPVQPSAHYIFLVHGWLGNDLEMAYLAESLKRALSHGSNSKHDTKEDNVVSDVGRERSPGQIVGSKTETTLPTQTEIVIHSTKCNVGKTHDGVKNGGTRLAQEIIDFIRSDLLSKEDKTTVFNHVEDRDNDASSAGYGHVTYSIIGNSLGGLYARYAISLLPYKLNISATSTHTKLVHLHPNIFCTTATPHLGVSGHTYLPIPRFAETIFGWGMRTTGRDLFRLNSEQVLSTKVSASDSSLPSCNNSNLNENNGESTMEKDAEDGECIIRNMCLQEQYLSPLRNFRKRIAFANAYRTDFQVPTETAAFLNPESDVCHIVDAARGRTHQNIQADDELEDMASRYDTRTGSPTTPSFVAAILRTEQQRLPIIQDNEKSPNELLQMSKSLDALGWTKVLIDVRNCIPLPGIPIPTWIFSQPGGTLDDLLQRGGRDGIIKPKEVTTTDGNTDRAIGVTSRELFQSSTFEGCLHIPLGHSVMVANSKSEAYSKFNSQGRPVMDYLAKDIIHDLLLFQ